MSKKNIYYSLLALSAFLLLFLILSPIRNKEETEKEESLPIEDAPHYYHRIIDNKEVLREEEISPFLFSAVIDNHPDARPAFSLSKAEVVYDVPAEGGINRYLAIFALDEEKEGLEIGPIRSARPYFLDIAKEYKSLLLHCGGSPEALSMISKDKLLSLNEFYNGAYYRRYPGYLAPHNVLAIFDKLKDYSAEESVFDSWKFKDESNVNLNDLSSLIKISNGQNQFKVLWEYDQDSNLYNRSLAGKRQVDNDGSKVSASNLVFQLVNTQVLDSELRLKIETLGSGDAVICIDGSCKEAYWKKTDNNSRTKYYYSDDKEVVFNTGKTWIHLLNPENTSLEY